MTEKVLGWTPCKHYKNAIGWCPKCLGGEVVRSWRYKLADDGRTPVPVDELLLWGAWFETEDRIVARDTIGDSMVSTVFLGIDHNFFGEGEPILWETLVFGGAHGGRMSRYSSYEDAMVGHEEMCDLVRGHSDG